MSTNVKNTFLNQSKNVAKSYFFLNWFINTKTILEKLRKLLRNPYDRKNAIIKLFQKKSNKQQTCN